MNIAQDTRVLQIFNLHIKAHKYYLSSFLLMCDS